MSADRLTSGTHQGGCSPLTCTPLTSVAPIAAYSSRDGIALSGLIPDAIVATGDTAKRGEDTMALSGCMGGSVSAGLGSCPEERLNGIGRPVMASAQGTLGVGLSTGGGAEGG